MLIDGADDRSASPAAAGMLAPVTEVHFGEEDLLRLNLASVRAYPGFVASLEEASGLDVGFVECGTLVVARDADENLALKELFAFQQRLGLEVRRLDSRSCRELEPALSPRIRGGIDVPGDHQVDNRRLLAALRRACEEAGVRIVEGRAESLLVTAGRASGVALTGGEEIEASAVVVAAGAWSSTLTGLGGASPPVRPVKGQLLHLRWSGDRPPVTRTIRGLDVYVVTRSDGRIVVGATMEERGFDTTVTAGGVYELLRDAHELVPDLVEASFVGAASGLRPATPDNAPLIGETSIPGLILATGHFRNGILLTPVTADAIASLLADGSPPAEVQPFSPRRFEVVPA